MKLLIIGGSDAGLDIGIKGALVVNRKLESKLSDIPAIIFGIGGFEPSVAQHAQGNRI